MKNWRQWIYDQLTTEPAVTALVPADRILSSGAITGRQHANPFIVIRMLPVVRQLSEGTAHRQNAEIWAHDQPGSYARIDTILAAVKATLVGPVPDAGAIACVWQGDSQDLADDGVGTITRNAAFACMGTGN